MALEYSRGSKVIPRPLTNLLELSSPTLIKVLTAGMLRESAKALLTVIEPK